MGSPPPPPPPAPQPNQRCQRAFCLPGTVAVSPTISFSSFSPGLFCRPAHFGSRLGGAVILCPPRESCDHAGVYGNPLLQALISGIVREPPLSLSQGPLGLDRPMCLTVLHKLTHHTMGRLHKREKERAGDGRELDTLGTIGKVCAEEGDISRQGRTAVCVLCFPSVSTALSSQNRERLVGGWWACPEPVP